jgi:hypothetical protein
MIKEDYVSFETAKLLKEKGFDEDIARVVNEEDEIDYLGSSQPSLAYLYHTWYKCPTLQMAMKWLRKEKGIAIIPIISSILDNEKFLWDVKIVVAKTNETYSQGWIYEEPEEAYETAIKYALENLI